MMKKRGVMILSADIFKGWHPSTDLSALFKWSYSADFHCQAKVWFCPPPSLGGVISAGLPFTWSLQRSANGCGDPSITGNDGISSISFMPLCCCANTAWPPETGQNRGWKLACLPITHLPALEREQSTRTYVARTLCRE